VGIILPDAPVNLYHFGVARSFWSHLKRLPLWTPAARVLSLSGMWLVHPSDPLKRKIHKLEEASIPKNHAKKSVMSRFYNFFRVFLIFLVVGEINRTLSVRGEETSLHKTLPLL